MSTPNNNTKADDRSIWNGAQLLTDGGETFCVACGASFNPERANCPNCGHPIGGGDDTGPAAGESTNKSVDSTTERSEGRSENEQVTQSESTKAAQSPQPEEKTDTQDGEANKSQEQSRKNSDTQPQAGPSEGYCPECGRVVESDTNQCPHCGLDRTSSGNHPILAGLLSLVIIGSGQVYNGDLKRGVGFFTGAVVLYASAFLILGSIISILLFGLWAWAGYDAYAGAK